MLSGERLKAFPQRLGTRQCSAFLPILFHVIEKQKKEKVYILEKKK